MAPQAGSLSGKQDKGGAGASSRFTKWLRKEGGGRTPHGSAAKLKVAPKAALKSIVCGVYESVFDGKDPEGAVPSWDEFWLLRVDSPHILHCLGMLTEAELVSGGVSATLPLFLNRAKQVACDSAANPTRRLRAFETIAAILRGILSKTGYTSYAVDVIRITCGQGDGSSFYGGLIRATAMVLESDSPRDPAQATHVLRLKHAASEALKSIICSQADTALNCLLELPVSILQQSSLFATVFSSYGESVGPTAVPLRSRHPERFELNVLQVFAVMVSHAREHSLLPGGSKRNAVAAFIGGTGGGPVQGLARLIEFCLHAYNRGIIQQTQSGSLSMSGSMGSGMLMGWMSYISGGGGGGGDAAKGGSEGKASDDLAVQRYYGRINAPPSGGGNTQTEQEEFEALFPEFHPSSPVYAPVPALLSASLMVVAEAASPSAPLSEFVDLLVSCQVDTREQFAYLRAHDRSHRNNAGLSDAFLLLDTAQKKGEVLQSSSYLFLELLLTTSIVLHLSKHPHVKNATGGVLLTWCHLLRQSRVARELFESSSELRIHFYATGKVLGSAWKVEASRGCPVKDSAASLSGAAAGTVFSLVDAFISTHLPSLYALEYYELALDALIHLVVQQMDSQKKIAWDWSHLFEKLLQVLKASLKSPLGESQMSRGLVKRSYHLFKLLLRKPTVLYSQDHLVALVYDMVRYKDVFTSLSERVAEYLKTATATTTMKGISTFVTESLKLIEAVEARVTESPSVDPNHLIQQVIDASDSNKDHDLLWQLPSALYEELSSVSREVDQKSTVSTAMGETLCHVAYVL